MAGIITLLVEIAFAASLVGFITIIMLIPTKKVVLSGQAGTRMDSPLVPALIGAGTFVAVLMVPLSLIADSSETMIAGLAGSVLLICAYLAIFGEYRSVKRLLRSTVPVEEAVHVHHAPDREGHRHHGGEGFDHTHMTVECPRCHRHLLIERGAATITCPHCGLSGSL